MPLLAINIKCMWICAEVSLGEGASSAISANGLRFYSVANLYQVVGARGCGLVVTKLFAALRLRDTEDCHDMSRYQILR